MKYHIYDKEEHMYLKRYCELVSIIEPGHTLTDDEVHRYFGINEDHRYWEKAHKPNRRLRRIVFDKIIIPDSPRFRIEPVYEYDYEI